MEGGNGGEYEVDPCKPPEEHAQGKITVVKACADHDGQVTITLTTVGGYDEVEFIVEGTTYKVEPGYSIDVVIGGLTDGTHHISVQAGYQDLSFNVEIACDLPPRVSVTKECKAFDGSVSIFWRIWATTPMPPSRWMVSTTSWRRGVPPRWSSMACRMA
jgi:hypothetical protein